MRRDPVKQKFTVKIRKAVRLGCHERLEAQKAYTIGWPLGRTASVRPAQIDFGQNAQTQQGDLGQKVSGHKF